MRESLNFLRFQEIKRAKCAQCDAYMWLTRVEPDEPGYDKRTFECFECKHVRTEIVKYR